MKQEGDSRKGAVMVFFVWLLFAAGLVALGRYNYLWSRRAARNLINLYRGE